MLSRARILICCIVLIHLAVYSRAQSSDPQELSNRKDTLFLDKNRNFFNVSYFIKNKLQYINYFKNNRMIETVSFQDNGNKEQILFLNDSDGGKDMEVNYYPSGKIRSINYYFGLFMIPDTVKSPYGPGFAGKLDGHSVEYYENGNESSEYTFINGKLNGMFEEFYPNGKLKTQGYYYNGVKKGILIDYNEKGIITKQDTLFLKH